MSSSSGSGCSGVLTCIGTGAPHLGQNMASIGNSPLQLIHFISAMYLRLIFSMLQIYV